MITYCIVAFLNVFFHVVKTLMIVKASKLVASTANCFCYTFSAVVVKFIAESDLMVAIINNRRLHQLRRLLCRDVRL